MIALVLAELTCSLESGMIYVALSPLYKIYGDPLSVGWLLTAFTLTSAASAALAGRLGDLFGRRRVILILLGLAAGGSLLSASTTDLSLIIVGRSIQGVSMAILPLGFGVLREAVDPKRLGLGVSIIGSTYTVGGGIGILIGGLIVDRFQWHGIFVVSAVMALLSFLLVFLFVPAVPARSHSKDMDILGGVLFAPAIALMLYGLAEGSGRGWTAFLLMLILAGFVLFATWFAYEWNRVDPLIDVRLLGRREVGLANLNIFVISIGPLLGPVMILPLLQQPVWTGVGFGAAATVAAFVKLPANALATVGSLLAGTFSQRIDIRLIMMASALVSALGWFGMIIWHDSFWLVCGLVVLSIVPSAAVLLVMTPQIIIQAAPEERTSEATGLTQVIRAFGKAIGVQMIALCFATQQIVTKEGGAYPGASAYNLVFIVSAGLSILSLVLCLLLPRGLTGSAKASVNS